MRIPLEQFDRRLDSVIGEAPPRPAPPGCGDRLARAWSRFHRGAYRECLRELEGLDPGSPEVRALRAAAASLLSGRARQGIRPCLEVARRFGASSDLLAALGLLLLGSGDRARAVRAFRAGLRMCPRHPALRARLREMGHRRRPVLPFLPRSHPANRWLGRIRHRLLTA